MTLTGDASTRRLAKQLVDFGRRLKHLETVPQLPHSSLDDQGMTVYDRSGEVAVTLGKQSDGTFAARPITGPIPPAPVGVSAEGDAGVINALWQGVFWGGAEFPRDFEGVEVLVDGAVSGAIHDPAGGAITIPAVPGERIVSFRTRSQAGVVSPVTGEVVVVVASRVTEQLDLAEGRIEAAEDLLAEHSVDIAEMPTTVVNDINVHGKLIGTDGVFTGTVDFENINVTGDLLASKISGEHLYGTVVEGGEIRTSSGATGGQFILGDDAFIFPDGLDTTPGIRFENPGSGRLVPAGIGTWNGDLRFSGGKAPDGTYTHMTVGATGFYSGTTPGPADEYGASVYARQGNASLAVAKPDGSEQYSIHVMEPLVLDGVEEYGGRVDLRADRGPRTGSIQVYEDSIQLRTSDGTGTLSEVRSDANEAYLFTRAGGANRYLTVDANGVWVKTNKSGTWESYNLEETANDSGWITVPVLAGITATNPVQYRVKGGIVWWRGRVKPTTGSWQQGENIIAQDLPAAAMGYVGPGGEIEANAALAASTGIGFVGVLNTGILRFYMSATPSYNLTVSALQYPVD